LARPLNLGSSQLGQQLRNIRGERLSSDSLAGFRGKSAPHPRGERGSEPRARASEARAQRPGSCSPTPFTHRRRGLASTAGNGSGCRDTKQVLQIPGRTVFTPCGAVSRRGVGPGTREERGERREGAGERKRERFEAHTDSRDRTFSEALGRSNPRWIIHPVVGTRPGCWCARGGIRAGSAAHGESLASPWLPLESPSLASPAALADSST
jgi:hypothetical protein